MKPHSQRGVALVITLVMLSVVTLMAITFLAVSRRERAAVSVTEEQGTARLMADAALARAQAEVVGRALQERNLLAYDAMVSTNFINPRGFARSRRGEVILTNVNYDYLVGGSSAFTEDDRLQNIANLFYDPRPPVYVRTNAADAATPALDFRYFLDLNRNSRFESNGYLPVVSPAGRYYSTAGVEVATGTATGVWTNYHLGDPEWIGVLERADLPHSASNRFTGRFAYLVIPLGKALDFNFIHNYARADRLNQPWGYYRNQGVGSWELNLAAFLHDLNTNVWRSYAYNGLFTPPASEAFNDAREFLSYRYAGDLDNLPSFDLLYGPAHGNTFERDYIDGYSDGPAFSGTAGLAYDNDRASRPWAGADNPRAYFEPQDLWDPTRMPVGGSPPLLTRLQFAQTGLSSYDRYTYYRWLAQMGFDAAALGTNRIHLNWDNRWPASPTNFIPWTPTAFFTNVAQRLIDVSKQTIVYRDPLSGVLTTNFLIGDAIVSTNFALTNMAIWPVNEYGASVHRLLQLAVNLYDATTNRVLTAYPHLPTVFRPIFAVTPSQEVVIAGYTEVTNLAFLNQPFLDLDVPADRNALARQPHANVYGVPLVIGAKKGFPSFNEFSLQNMAQFTRKLEVRKPTPNARPFETNQMFLLSISNFFGLEAWNSYTQAFPRTLRVRAAGDFMQTLTNYALPNATLVSTNLRYATNYTLGTWPGQRFLLPIFRQTVLVPEAVYRTVGRPFELASTSAPFERGRGFYVPHWALLATNRFYFALIDEQVGRVVDYVSFAGMSTVIDLTREVMGRDMLQVAGSDPEPANVWRTNRMGSPLDVRAPTEGVLNQISISMGMIPVSDQQWRSYSQLAADGLDKEKAIDRFLLFLGLTPLTFNDPIDRARLQSDIAGKTAMQAPYTPSRKLYQQVSWQVNDPLVHYTLQDLLDPNNPPNDPNRTNAVRFAVPPQFVPTNSNLGLLNDRYRPWGGNPNHSNDPQANDASVKDPLIARSDDWDFPTNRYPSVGWIGRVHRGTPWQTVYLKSRPAETNAWFQWAGSFGTHPTNDWKFVGHFTAAPNENATRGQLGINQTNLAAWSAVLGGVSVLTNTTPLTGARTNTGLTYRELFIPPNSPHLERIVAGLNATRYYEPGGTFHSLGRLLATPELTFRSPFLSTNHVLSDEVLERIPQQVLSLVRADEPRFAVYAFGQALREAPASVYVGAGEFNRLCTNYQIRAEYATRAVIRLEGPLTHPRVVIESYNELPVR